MLAVGFRGDGAPGTTGVRDPKLLGYPDTGFDKAMQANTSVDTGLVHGVDEIFCSKIPLGTRGIWTAS